MWEAVNNFVSVMFSSFAIIYTIFILKSEKQKEISKKATICFLFLSLALYINNMYFTGIIKTGISFLIITIVINMVLDRKIKNCFLPAFAITTLLFLSEVITLIVLSTFVKNISYLLNNDSFFKIFSTVMVMSLMYGFVNIRIIRNKFILISNMEITRKTTINMIIIATIIGISVLFVNLSNNNLFFLNLLMIFLFLFLSFSSINDKYNKNKIIEEYNQLFKYIKNYEEIMEKQRIEKHEYKNQLIAIKGMVSNKNKELNIYIDNIIGKENKVKNLWIEKLKNIPTGGLKGLLLYKISEIENNNINISLDIEKRVDKFKFSALSSEEYSGLCRVLGVFLDNAKEASEKCEDKQVGIEIIFKNGRLCFIISNTFCDTIDIQKLEKKGYSTKGFNRGYGLFLAKQTIDSNIRFKSEREIVNNYYIQKLIIKA